MFKKFERIVIFSAGCIERSSKLDFCAQFQNPDKMQTSDPTDKQKRKKEEKKK
jgi:hypothetical protein